MENLCPICSVMCHCKSSIVPRCNGAVGLFAEFAVVFLRPPHAAFSRFWHHNSSYVMQALFLQNFEYFEYFSSVASMFCVHFCFQ